MKPAISLDEYIEKASVIRSTPKKPSETQADYIEILDRLSKSKHRSRSTWQTIMKAVDKFPIYDDEGLEYYKELIREKSNKSKKKKTEEPQDQISVEELCELENDISHEEIKEEITEESKPEKPVRRLVKEVVIQTWEYLY